MEELESKDYSWKWVTGDELLSHGACEFVSAHIFPRGQGTCNVVLYNGENTNGETIFSFSTPTDRVVPVNPKKPIYCRRGLYVGGTSMLDGVLVQWRELGHGGGG